MWEAWNKTKVLLISKGWKFETGKQTFIVTTIQNDLGVFSLKFIRNSLLRHASLIF